MSHRCDLPPIGWQCTRPRGHRGPCAAIPSNKVDLRDSGLLWLINRVVFHPRGFALGIHPDGSFSLEGNGREPWHFTEGEDELFDRVEQTLAKR